MQSNKISEDLCPTNKVSHADDSMFNSPKAQKSKCINVEPRTKRELYFDNLSGKSGLTPNHKRYAANLNFSKSPYNERTQQKEDLKQLKAKKFSLNSKMMLNFQEDILQKEESTNNFQLEQSLEEDKKLNKIIDGKNRKIISDNYVKIVISNDFFSDIEKAMYLMEKNLKKEKSDELTGKKRKRSKRTTCKCQGKGCIDNYCRCVRKNNKCSDECKCSNCTNSGENVESKEYSYLIVSRETLEENEERGEKNLSTDSCETLNGSKSSLRSEGNFSSD